MKYFLIILLIVAVVITAVLLTKPVNFLSRAGNNNTNAYTVGPEEIVLEIDQDHIPDYPYFTYLSNNGLKGVLSVGGPVSQRGYEVASPTASTVTNLTAMPGVVKGTNPNDLDYRGVWMNGTYRQENSNIIQGIYHAEKYESQAEDSTLYSIAYIESPDGGRTWVKPNYPNNYLITGYNGKSKIGGADPYSLVEVGNDVYLYYFEHTGSIKTRGMAVAKAPKSGISNSSSWKKYYCGKGGSCNFKQPALGGDFTKLSGIKGQAWVTYNTYLNKFLAVDGGPLLNGDNLQFRQSTNGTNFVDYGFPVSLGNSMGEGWYKVYPSIVNIDGSTGTTDKDFYVYYVAIKRNPLTGEVLEGKRYLLRRKVTLENSAWVSTTDTNLIDLARYYSPAAVAHIYEPSLTNKETDENWKDEGICCQVNSVQIPGTVPLYRVNNSTDFFMETTPSQIAIAEKSGYSGKTKMGYCWKNQVEGTVPLYRFYNNNGTNHFYTASENEKQTVEKLPEWTYEGITCYVKP